MESASTQTFQHKREPQVFPRPLRAILTIASSTPELQKIFRSHINVETWEISWDRIFVQDFDLNTEVALDWAYAIWVGATAERNIRVYAMNGPAAVGVLEALMIAWGEVPPKNLAI